MAATAQTLNSRLRVLIAKTFRAEKLYSSMRNSLISEQTELTRLSELANSVRAEVWQQAHAKLRKLLNDALGKAAGTSLLTEVVAIRNHFFGVQEQSTEKLGQVKASLIEYGNKDEFAHSLKLSLELIRLKAQVQANQIIAEELSTIVNSSRKGEVAEPSLLFEDKNSEEAQVAHSAKVLQFRRVGTR